MRLILAFTLLISATVAVAAPINPILYVNSGNTVVDFNDVAGSPFPGTLYDGILVSGGASFAERFVGQTLSFNGDLDVLSGTPSGPLALQVGTPGQNLSVGTDTGGGGLYPYGPNGYPSPTGYGEGAWAVLFPNLTARFGFEVEFGEDVTSTVIVQAFRADGSLIDSLTVNLTPAIIGFGGFFGFEREGGLTDIAGVSVHTTDPGGLGYFGVRYDTAQVTAPEPATLTMLAMGVGLLGMTLRRNREQRPQHDR